MPDPKDLKDSKESKTKELPREMESKPDLAQIFGMGIIRIMREGRPAMQQLEAEFDAYTATLSFEEKKKMRDDVLAMAMNAKLALESIYVRVQQSF